MKNKKLFILLIFSLLTAASGWSESMNNYLAGINPDILAVLQKDGEVFREDRDHKGLLFIPDNPLSAEIKKVYTNINPSVVSEALYLIPYTEEINTINTDLYNLILQVRDISSVKYYSSRQDAAVPLFEEVYRIDSLNYKKPLPDETVTEIPERKDLLIYMKEVNFGPASYNLELTSRNNSLLLNLTNASVIRKFIRVVDRKKMSLQLLVTPVDEGFLVYGLCSVNLSNYDFVTNLLDPYSAFYKRLYALEIWMYNTLHGTDRTPKMGKAFKE